jgi:hypothetical protein
MGRQCDIELLSYEGVRHAVEALLDFDVVIDANPGLQPFRKAVGLPGKRLQGRSIELFEKIPAAFRSLLERPGVEVLKEFRNRFVEFP